MPSGLCYCSRILWIYDTPLLLCSAQRARKPEFKQIWPELKVLRLTGWHKTQLIMSMARSDIWNMVLTWLGDCCPTVHSNAKTPSSGRTTRARVEVWSKARRHCDNVACCCLLLLCVDIWFSILVCQWYPVFFHPILCAWLFLAHLNSNSVCNTCNLGNFITFSCCIVGLYTAISSVILHTCL
jgi:hypothetical protein